MTLTSTEHRECVAIWLAVNHDDDAQHQLRQLVPSLKTFSKTDQCIDYIKTHYGFDKQRVIFLIISDSLAEYDIPILHALPQIDSIYIYGDNKWNCVQLIAEWRKIQGIYDNMTLICDQLKININKTNLEKNNHQDVTFMYSILLNEILINTEPDLDERNIFIDYCRKLYAQNHIELRRIDEFQRDYRPDQAIRWYTSPFFLYSILNWTQRKQDINIFVKMQFFIRDLYQQLQRLYIDSLPSLSPTFVVYRGQSMSQEHFQTKLKNNVGGLFSIRTFWSTHIDRKIAEAFMKTEYPDREYVLLQITINTTLVSDNIYNLVFANISHLSMIPEEQEILFSPGAVFRIESIDKDKESWNVNLTLTNDYDPYLRERMNDVRKDIDGPTGRHRLANLLVKMGEFETAQNIYRVLLDTSGNRLEQMPVINYQLGLIHKEKGDFAWALKRYHKALQETSRNSSHRAAVLTEIGNVLQHQNHLDQAMEYHQRALEIELDDAKIIALRYANLGSTLCAQRKFDEALTALEQALQYTLPKRPERAKIFDQIGSVYYALESYSTALLYYQTALETGQNSLLPTHPDNVRIRSNITKALDKLNRV